MLLPSGEVSHLAIVPVIRKPHLRADEENLVVVNDDTAVVDDVLVRYGPFKVLPSGANRYGGNVLLTHIPTSHNMSDASSDCRSLTRISQE